MPGIDMVTEEPANPETGDATFVICMMLVAALGTAVVIGKRRFN